MHPLAETHHQAGLQAVLLRAGLPRNWALGHFNISLVSGQDSETEPAVIRIPPEDIRNGGIGATGRIQAALEDAFMLFIAVDSVRDIEIEAAALIVRIARGMNILTIAVSPRNLVASVWQSEARLGRAIEQLSSVADSLLVLGDGGPDGSFDQALKRTCDLFAHAILGSSLIIPDFEDIRTVIEHGGLSFLSEGEAKGSERARIAADEAIARLTEIGVDMRDIPGLLCFITVRSADRIFREVREVKSALQTLLSKSIDLVFGTIDDEAMGESLRVTLVATGLHDGRSDTSLFGFNGGQLK